MQKELSSYYCGKCHEIPELFMNKDTSVRIKCRCDPSNDKTITLTKMSSEINTAEEPICSQSDKHGEKRGKKYCTSCNKWYCDKCFNEHNTFKPKHIGVLSKGAHINSLCENKSPKCSGLIEFYCKDCKIHLCKKCKDNHDDKHVLTELKKIYDEKRMTQRVNKISEITEAMKKDITGIKNVLEEVRKKLEQYNELIQLKEKETENISNYFNSLANAYLITKNIPNYYIYNNLTQNNIEEIYKERKKGTVTDINNKVKDLIKAMPEKEILEAKETNLGTNKIIDYHPIEEKKKSPEKKKEKKEVKIITPPTEIKGKENPSEGNEGPKQSFVQKQLIHNNHKVGKGITCLLISSNNKLFSGGFDGNICGFINDQKGFEFENILKGHKGIIYSLCKADFQGFVDPNRPIPTETSNENETKINTPLNMILSSSSDGSIKLWDTDNYKCLISFEGHKGGIFKVITTEDGKIVSASGDNTIKIWNTEGKNTQTLEGHSDGVVSLIELKNGNLISGSWDSTLKIWDMKNYQCLTDYTISNVFCYRGGSMLYSKEEDVLFVGGNGRIKIIDLKHKIILREVKNYFHDQGISSILKLANGRFIIGLDGQQNQLLSLDKDLKDEYIINYPFKANLNCIVLAKENTFLTGDGVSHLICWSY
ncbi:MAG: hypothetical protein MJ252_25655 [archaeon]|nr:hypothetical protein [archaeon]